MHRLSFSSISSNHSDDDGLVHRRGQTHLAEPNTTTMDRSRQASTSSERSCEALSLDEARELWKCMLELQQRYGCYNSTRIDMALLAGDDGVEFMPNRFIIDVLNESLVDLPDEGREMLNRHLCPAESRPPKQKRKLWRKQ